LVCDEEVTLYWVLGDSERIAAEIVDEGFAFAGYFYQLAVDGQNM
jgi:hypothetical protein